MGFSSVGSWIIYKLSFLGRKALEVGFKSQIKKHGLKETEHGVNFFVNGARYEVELGK